MRNTKHANDRFPTFPSAAALAGALQVPARLVLADKAAGLPGFRASNAVDTADYLRGLIQRGRPEEAETLDVDASRARLNSVRADVLIRNARLADGELVPALWVAEVMDEAFGMFLKGIRGRISNLANLLTICARQETFAQGLAQVTQRLENDARELGNGANMAKAEMLLRLRQGPPEAGGATAWARFEDRAREVADKLSDSARRELHAALACETPTPKE